MCIRERHGDEPGSFCVMLRVPVPSAVRVIFIAVSPLEKKPLNMQCTILES